MIICIQQNTKAYFQSDWTISAKACFKLVLSKLPINFRVADKNNKLLDVISCRYLCKIKGQNNSVQISGIYCMHC